MLHSPTSIVRLRIPIGDKIAIGPGKAALLEAIEETGSISAAGRSLRMSYRKAWLLVRDMNRFFAEPVVEATKGGANGGRARLTGMGSDVLQQYRKLERAAWGAISGKIGEFAKLLKDSQ